MRTINGLSRRLDWKISVKKDNENQKLIKEEWIHNLTEVVIEKPCYKLKTLGLVNRKNLVLG